MQAAALAAHRFGYSETSLRGPGSDPRAWVLAQFAPGAQTPFDASGLLDGPAALRLTGELLRAAVPPAAAASSAEPRTNMPALALRRANRDALQRRWQHIITTDTPVAERWVQFWANHCCVAATKGSTRALVWPHENEAIRPQALGRFSALLRASTLHPAMLLYLDNAQSMGPQSRAGLRRERGLNENLARELLELHTLGVNGGYSQADVSETARLLTGWTVRLQGGDGRASFQPALHQPGPKTVLGRRYPEGPEALDLLLQDLALHPATARHLAGKLALHFVSDTPPPALVDALARRWRESGGDLRQVAQALFEHPATWSPQNPPKLKRPEELLLSAHRQLKLPLGDRELDAGMQTLTALGQAPGRAPSPQGWPDRSEDWLSPDALLKRVQWAERFAQRHAQAADARALARLALGEDLGESTRLQIERAADGAQALALWLASPEFQRR
jgi:uncharacterized protein (DUF1800 family)